MNGGISRGGESAERSGTGTRMTRNRVESPSEAEGDQAEVEVTTMQPGQRLALRMIAVAKSVAAAEPPR